MIALAARLISSRSKPLKLIMRIALILLAGAGLAAQTPETEWRWISLASGEVEVNGLAWYSGKSDELLRLPQSLEKTFRPAVWNLAKSPSGGRIRFRTDSNVLAVRLEYPSAPDMANMHAFGQTGMDLYADGIYIASAVADKDAGPGKNVQRTFFDLMGRRRVEREITLYLPLYKPVKVLGVAVDKEAKINRARPFALSKPVVFYGTSITQGGCASRSGMSYQAILSRMLNTDFVNLGFSGNGMGEPEVARVVADIDAACFVLDFAQNNRTVEALQQVYAPFVETLRAKHPETPIVAITPIYASREALNDPGRTELQQMRDHIREVVSLTHRGRRSPSPVGGGDRTHWPRSDGWPSGWNAPKRSGFSVDGRGTCGQIAQSTRPPVIEFDKRPPFYRGNGGIALRSGRPRCKASVLRSS